MKRFFNDIKKYYKYTIYATKAELNSEVAGSYLGWLWWFLEPLCFMLVYAFMVVVIFNTSEQYMLAFVFIGNTIWTFFNKATGCHLLPLRGCRCMSAALRAWALQCRGRLLPSHRVH